LLGTAGSNTANNPATVALAPNKVPSAVAVSNDNELAFVSLWDTVALKGQVAVVALAGLCDGCSPTGDPSTWYEWWHEWKGVYPGLPNMGNTVFMKVLGYIDLPFAAPTEIAVTTGMHQFNTVLPGGNFMGADNSPLPSFYQTFAPGGSNYGRTPKGGVVVVLSKSENKAAFIDLKPLFTYLQSMYFTSQINSIYPASSPQKGTVGPAPTQWPYTF